LEVREPNQIQPERPWLDGELVIEVLNDEAKRIVVKIDGDILGHLNIRSLTEFARLLKLIQDEQRLGTGQIKCRVVLMRGERRAWGARVEIPESYVQ
jgi:hypothetical protein